ncbi:MAG: hypothetical protein Q9167_004668 [Letrouitia subvulpina]
MASSARFGQPPATQNDYYIVKALLSRSSKLAAMDPAKGFPMPMPPNAPHDNGADRIYAGAIITIFFLLFITGIRVVSRRLAKPNALGWDDFFIVLAAASACSWFGMVLGITTSVMHMAFDWVLLAVPIYLVLKLQMPWTKKLQCVIPLSLGALSSAGACVRTYDGLHPAKDPTHHLIYQTGWNVCDFLLAVTVTSLPACKKVLVDLTSTFSNRYFFTINGSRKSPSLRFSPPRSDDGSERQRHASRDFDVESMVTNQMVDDRSTRALYLKDWRMPSEGEVQIENEVLKAGGDGSIESKNPFDDRRFLHGGEV